MKIQIVESVEELQQVMIFVHQLRLLKETKAHIIQMKIMLDIITIPLIELGEQRILQGCLQNLFR